jgi:hypothetical protein
MPPLPPGRSLPILTSASGLDSGSPSPRFQHPPLPLGSQLICMGVGDPEEEGMRREDDQPPIHRVPAPYQSSPRCTASCWGSGDCRPR